MGAAETRSKGTFSKDKEGEIAEGESQTHIGNYKPKDAHLEDIHIDFVHYLLPTF